MTRRWLVGGCIQAAGLLVIVNTGLAAERSDGAFGFDEVVRMARETASHPYVAPDTKLPEHLARLTYDDYRRIRFRKDRALWQGTDLRFRVEFFARASWHSQRIDVAVVDRGRVAGVPFSPGQFDTGEPAISLPADAGFAGLRVHYPLNRADRFDELLVFLDASYFRAVGAGQVYGASARGIVVHPAEGAEEFPSFRRFWLVTPSPEARAITLWALLDGPSIAGAYEFTVHPGEATVIDVTAILYPRKRVAKLGLAPLTSMFQRGEAGPWSDRDFRPEVHDSDGLLMAAGSGEWIWRPLQRPARLRTYQFDCGVVRGFGLMQRDREFDHYQDLEAGYEKRPSIWVEPVGAWPAGRVELLELPSDKEIHDNIGASWVLREAPPPGTELKVRYRVVFSLNDPAGHTGGKVVATRRAGNRILIDFRLPGSELADSASPPKAVVSPNRGITGPVVVQRNPYNQSWRVFFDVVGGAEDVVELRAFLRTVVGAATETWSYAWTR